VSSKRLKKTIKWTWSESGGSWHLDTAIDWHPETSPSAGSNQSTGLDSIRIKVVYKETNNQCLWCMRVMEPAGNDKKNRPCSIKSYYWIQASIFLGEKI